jgi:hypothetical protein
MTCRIRVKATDNGVFKLFCEALTSQIIAKFVSPEFFGFWNNESHDTFGYLVLARRFELPQFVSHKGGRGGLAFQIEWDLSPRVNADPFLRTLNI